MHIDKYRTASGDYLLSTGERYQSAEELLYRGIMGFEGLAQAPMFAYIRARLARIRASQDVHSSGATLGGLRDEEEKAEIESESGGREPFWFGDFFSFWADRKRITRPGREIPLWLTTTGQELLDDLIALKA